MPLIAGWKKKLVLPDFLTMSSYLQVQLNVLSWTFKIFGNAQYLSKSYLALTIAIDIAMFGTKDSNLK